MTRKLFGNAIEIVLPNDEAFICSSNIRPTPDNQEVFTHMDKPLSVIVEIVEPANDVDPTHISLYHFEQLAEENSAQIIKGSVRGPIPVNVAKSFTVGMQQITKSVDGSSEQSTYLVYIGVLRVPENQADILVSLNVQLDKPYATVDGPESDYVYQQEFAQMLQSLTIVDYGLFGKPAV